VRLTVEPECVRLIVRDVGDHEVAPPVENGGLGVRGMRERATALGGSVDARPDGRGWTVDATLPREEPPAGPERRRGRC
jgi:signal transduction histidine kinase